MGNLMTKLTLLAEKTCPQFFDQQFIRFWQQQYRTAGTTVTTTQSSPPYLVGDEHNPTFAGYLNWVFVYGRYCISYGTARRGV